MSRRDSDGNDSIKSIPYEKESSVLQSSQWHKSQQQYRYPPDTFPTPYSINLQSSIVNLCFLNFERYTARSMSSRFFRTNFVTSSRPF